MIVAVEIPENYSQEQAHVPSDIHALSASIIADKHVDPLAMGTLMTSGSILGLHSRRNPGFTVRAEMVCHGHTQ